MAKGKFIWIIGENHGSTADNNSFFFWKYAVNVKDNIEKYIVFERNGKTQEAYNSLSSHERKYVVWKNSRKHFRIYNNADLLFVTLSYKDVTPTKILVRDLKLKITKPLVYLRHGTAGMKKTNYTGKSFWNHMFKFLSFNPTEPQHLIDNNSFQRHQVLSADFLPRYCEFVRKDEEFTDKSQILWFITWREYFGSNAETKVFINVIKNVVKSQRLKEYLQEKGLTLKICVHQFFDKETIADIYEEAQEGIIEIAHSQDINVMDELVKSSMLITDYSSVAYDFSFLERPVLLFQPDLEKYTEMREFMCDMSEMEKYNILTSQELVDAIIEDKFELNLFFRNNWPENIDYAAIKEGRHIGELYDYFAHLQNNKVTILGLSFYEHSNVVDSTMSLAEKLLDAGYLVEMISLYRNVRYFNAPNGLPMKSLYWEDTTSLKDKAFRKTHSKSSYGYLKYDSRIDAIDPSAAYYLKKLMSNIRSRNVISTRESLHLYLNECKSDYVENKIYYFHTPLDSQNENYKMLLDKIREIDIEKSIFVSEDDVRFFEEELNFKTPSSKVIFDSYIAGNQILKPIDFDSEFINEDYRLIRRDINSFDRKYERELIKEYMILELLDIEEKDSYTGICMVSFDDYYSQDLENVIEFGKYLKENNIDNITLDVVGSGNSSEKFMEMISENDLFGYINFFGNQLNVLNEIRRHDFVLDLSVNPNYNNFYLLGVLNYKKVFCLKNERSQKIFKDIPNTFIESNEWLCNQIYDIPKLSLKDLDDYYWAVRNEHISDDISEIIDYLEN